PHRLPLPARGPPRPPPTPEGDRRPGRVWRRPGQTGLSRSIGISTPPRTPAGSRFVADRRAYRRDRPTARPAGHPSSGRRRPARRCAPMKDIGLVGVPFSGTSTLFTAVTHAGSHGGQANLAVVAVPDPRVEVLTQIERSAKTVHAQVRFVDVPGGVSSAQGLARLREVDALAIVVRCFGPNASPASDLAEVRADLLLADLAVIEGALGKAEKKARVKPGPEVDTLRA